MQIRIRYAVVDTKTQRTIDLNVKPVVIIRFCKSSSLWKTFIQGYLKDSYTTWRFHALNVETKDSFSVLTIRNFLVDVTGWKRVMDWLLDVFYKVNSDGDGISVHHESKLEDSFREYFEWLWRFSFCYIYRGKHISFSSFDTHRIECLP